MVTDSKEDDSHSSHNVLLRPREQAKRKWIVPVTALIMTLATVGTASYSL
ncbi:MAG: hypothetical protein ACREIF_07145 [Chthoniobacterales bacterium]